MRPLAACGVHPARITAGWLIGLAAWSVRYEARPELLAEYWIAAPPPGERGDAAVVITLLDDEPPR